MPKKLIGDQIRLKQVLVNLTKNALKFSFNRWVKIRACYDPLNELLKVEVVDNGLGISAAQMSKLFKLFGKLGESSSELENIEGIGMGLFICKQIVTNLGGNIDCYSAGEGRGSTFTFTMPMAEPPEETMRINNL